MNRAILLLQTALFLTALCADVRAKGAAMHTRGEPNLARSRQLVLVTTEAWDSARGSLQRFERKNTKAKWHPVGARFPVVVGRNGLGWGTGLNAQAGEGPSKKEGDGRAPAGIYRLGSAFGFAPMSEAAWLKMPYMSLTSRTECVDDTKSRRYNLIVDGGAVKNVDWNSSERMRSIEGYRWGVVVEHNTAPPVAGKGSCIFLHIWAGPENGTAGCTAMDKSNLEELMRWLDPQRRPVLVQLPEPEHLRLQTGWRLP